MTQAQRLIHDGPAYTAITMTRLPWRQWLKLLKPPPIFEREVVLGEFPVETRFGPRWTAGQPDPNAGPESREHPQSHAAPDGPEQARAINGSTTVSTLTVVLLWRGRISPHGRLTASRPGLLQVCPR